MDALVYGVAAGFAAMGLYALAAPAGVLAIFGVRVETPAGRNEVRAVYGGFGLAVAAVLAVAGAGSGEVSEGILVAVSFALVGMAAGRVVGAALDRPQGLYPVWVMFLVELIGAAALLVAAWS
jgi:Domain of unknown function (DUF4345)